MRVAVSDTIFLAFSLDRFLRRLPMWMGVLLFLGIFLVIIGIIYLYTRIKAASAIARGSICSTSCAATSGASPSDGK